MFLSDKRVLLQACAFLAVLLFSLSLFLPSFRHSRSRSLQKYDEDENHGISYRSFLPHRGSVPAQNASKRHSPHPLSTRSPEADNNKSSNSSNSNNNSNNNSTMAAAVQCQINLSDRFDCFPEHPNPHPSACLARGCCYDNATTTTTATSARGGNGPPACFFSRGAGAYRVVSLAPIEGGGGATVGLNATLVRSSGSGLPADVLRLRLLVLFESEVRVRFKIYDPSRERYEVPVDLHDDGSPTSGDITHYTVNVTRDPFSISVLRKRDGQPLFDSRGMAPLIFADQYLQLGSALGSRYLYGLGNHRAPLLLDVPGWQKLVFWNRDQPPKVNSNLYGSHPFYLNLEPSGNAHGVFLLNSNAMQVDLQPYHGTGAVTYRVTGGVLDFFVFSGPSPEDVVRQYVTMIGAPYLPPLWALGFSLCRHGYGSSAELWKVIHRNRAARMPYDIQWNDLDYARDNLVWTWDNKTYQGLPEIIDDLHVHGQHNVIIIEPGVSSTQPPGSYPPFDLGVEMDVFMKNATGGLLIGKVWPGETAFVDFFHPNASEYWLTCIVKFHHILPFDGLWIDMNEPSNFVNGSVYNCTNNSLDKPPFVPPGIDGGSLYSRTTCPSAKQYLSSHYNLHNLYGWSQIGTTMESLQLLYNRRTLVLSRSTAPGSGAHGAHWTGDNFSSFSDMYFSIPAILTSGFFGISMVGADICGFNGDATRELCIRWMQVGAFYPFMRNHAELNTLPQDPGWFDQDAQDLMRSALETRYSLLPYLYTRCYLSHTTGAPTVRPLFFDYPGTESIDRQFLWGSELLISPVLDQGGRTVSAFIPNATWYDLRDLTRLNATGGRRHVLPAPLSRINVHVRGGSVLPMVAPAVTTTLARKQKMELLVAPDLRSQPVTATGQLYWDDGDSLEPLMTGAYSLVTFSLHKSTLTSAVQTGGYGPVTLGKVKVMGVDVAPVNVTLNGATVGFTYHPPTKVLVVWGLSVDLLSPFSLTWH